ncbi:hypothetical protein [Alkalibacillus aidingensis]|uniref:hypothetical protein n=1 Tax=Alkalibacillus aidingensis TaxID=2747607 RepID=UPI001660CB73|nr:hypothetical protein [Alkalibacillus aidingensis]
MKATKYYFFLLLIGILIGCNTQSKAEIIEDSKPSVPFFDYNITIVVEDEEQISELNEEIVSEFESIQLKSVMTTTYAWDDQSYDYTTMFGITEYPTFIVIGHDGLILSTSDLEELKNFFENV